MFLSIESHKEFLRFKISWVILLELLGLKRPILSYNFTFDKNLVTKLLQRILSLSESSSFNIIMALFTWAISDLFIVSPELLAAWILVFQAN